MNAPQSHPVEEIPERFRIGEWSIDPSLDEISRGAEVVKLEPRMMRLLCRLAESHGHVVSSQALLDSVWAGVIVGPHSVYQGIFALRKTLGDTSDTPTYIATVARKGYRLVAPVELPAHSATTPATGAPSGAATDTATSPSRRFSPWAMATVALAAVAVIAGLIALLAPGKQESAPPISIAAEVTWPPPDLPSLSILPLQPTTPGAANELFAATVTDILENRLMTQKGLLLVSMYSAGKLRQPEADVREIGKRLNVKYVLRGNATRDSSRIQVSAALLDTTIGAPIWSQSFEGSAQEVTKLREELVSQLGTLLHVHMDRGGNTTVNLDAHQEYVRGMQEFRRSTSDGYGAARDIFQRATELYPDYPRNYFGLAIAVKMFEWNPDPRGALTDEKRVDLQRGSVDRALQLDPQFGGAILERAMITPDPREAEAMLLRGMDLVPSDGIGPFFYTVFLRAQGRDGEAIAVIDRGLRIDPLSSILMLWKALYLVEYRGDVAEQQATLREILENNPQVGDAALWLGNSLYTNSGETAEAIAILEREAARDSSLSAARNQLALAYLEVDDPAAAAAAGKGLLDVDFLIAQYRGGTHPLRFLPPGGPESWLQGFHFSSDSIIDAVRDEALTTGNYAAALAIFEKSRTNYPRTGLSTVILDLRHAHTLLLSGDTDRGRDLVNSVLRTMEVEQVGRPPYSFARARATAYALLGDDERALNELATSVQHKDISRWRYTAEQDPVFTRLRNSPRFQALAQTVKQHRADQRALLDEMRRKGEVPKRP